MKTKFFTIVFTLLLVCIGAKAQDKARSIALGFSPFGYTHVNITYGDEKYKYDYKSIWGANIGYERQFKGVTSLTELTYLRASFDKYDLTGTSKWFNPAQEEDLTAISITTYAGKTLNPNKRVQFPVYIGIGADYASGGPIHNLILEGALKARVKFYITDKIGIYAGATGRIGYGFKSASEKSSKNSSSKGYTIFPILAYADAGIIFGI